MRRLTKTTEGPVLQELELPAGKARNGFELPLPVGLLGVNRGMSGLREMSIAIIGCGSVGGRAALQFARAGIGSLLLADPKKYKAGSLATHEIGPADVGEHKAQVTGRRCKEINRQARVLVFSGPVELLELDAMADLDLVVMAPDLLSAEVEVAQRCLWLGKPLMQASVHGATLTAQIRLFRNSGMDEACPYCAYGRDELDLLNRQVRFSCEGVRPGARGPAGEGVQATNSLSALCSMAADLAVIQALRFLLQAGKPVTNTMLEYCGFTHRTVISPLLRSPKCQLQHAPLQRVQLEVPLATLSLAEVARRVMGSAHSAETRFTVAGADWVEFASCRCAQPTQVRRFLPRGIHQLASCQRCGAATVPLSFYRHREVSGSVLGHSAERPLNRLGVRRASSIVVRSEERGVLVRQQLSNLPK